MSLFGGSQPQAATQTVASGVAIQSSVYGSVVPVVYGRTRMTGNLIDYDDFKSIAHETDNGGKGGGGDGAKNYTYAASFLFGLAEGGVKPDGTPQGGVTAIGTYWASKSSAAFTGSSLTLLDGRLGQSAWGPWQTNHPDKALGYSGTAYVAALAYDLGDSAQLPNLSFEATGLYPNAIPSLPDADPADVVTDVLTDSIRGVGFPSARLADLSVFSGYCRAAGLVVSPLFDTQTSAANALSAIVEDCNAAFVWSGTQLTVVPYGDTDLSANGATYTAPAAPLYSLTDDDFLDLRDGDPVQCARARPSDQMNSIKLEWLNRSNDYNAEIIETKNQAAIEAYGLRTAQPRQAHYFCDRKAATLSATLRLQRQSVRNVYSFTLGWRYCLLDPMDIVEITDSGLGLDRQWVRILSLEEDDNGNIRVTAEEYLGGTGHAPLYSFESGTPYNANFNAPPGNINAPFIFEPPPAMLAALSLTAPQIMIGVSGGANWGGCDVWLSLDDATYKRMGRILAPARQGSLTAPLPAGAGTDTTHTLSVLLEPGSRPLQAGTKDDADSFRTLCYVDGELISYENRSLTAADTYGLTYLRRGVYGSTVSAHAAGTAFCRLDDAVARFDLPVDPVSYVGKTLYLKFTSFNVYGGGLQSTADVEAITYNPNGQGVFVYPPTDVSFTVGAEQQKDGSWISFGVVSWSASADPFFDMYEVQYRLHAGPGPWVSWRCGPDTTSFRISPIQANTAYDVQVRAVRTKGPFYSAWDQDLNTASVGKTTAPPAPTGLSVVGGYRQITLDWTASAENDIAWYEVWEGGTSSFGSAARIALINATHYVRPGLNLDDIRYYWVRAQDTSGNFSAFLGPGHATTLGVDAADLTSQIIAAQIAEGAVIGSKIADDAIDITKIATGYGLPASVGSLPGPASPLRYEGSLVVSTVDGKLYRFTGGSWTKATDGADLTPDSVTTGAIVAGAITAPLIDAGAVTASKLYVGDTTNLINDPIFQDIDTGGTTPPYWTIADSTGACASFNSGTTPPAFFGRKTAVKWDCTVLGGSVTATIDVRTPASLSAGNAPMIPVEQGHDYRFRAYFRSFNSCNKSAFLRVRFFDTTGTQLASPTGVSSPAIDPTDAKFHAAQGAPVELNFTAPQGCAYVQCILRVQGSQPDTGAGAGQWFAAIPRLERVATGTLIQDGAITTEHIVAAGLDASAITAGTVTGDRMHANFIDGENFTTVHAGGQSYLQIDGRSVTVGSHQNGPAFRINDGTHNRVILGQLQDAWGLWIYDATGHAIFEEASLANGVVLTNHLAAGAVSIAYGTTVGASVPTLFSQTMPAAGDFVFTGSIAIGNNGGPPVGKISVTVNGTEVAHQPWSMGPYDITASFAYKVAVSSGDTVFVQAIVTNLASGGEANWNGGSFFGVLLQR